MDAEIETLAERPAVEAVVCGRLPHRWRSRRPGPMSDTQAIAVLAALGHQVRLGLWRLLLPYGEAGLAAGIIAARMSILPSSLSFHLKLMTQAGILLQRRSSRHIMYAVNVELVANLADLFSDLTPHATIASEEVTGLSGDC